MTLAALKQVRHAIIVRGVARTTAVYGPQSGAPMPTLKWRKYKYANHLCVIFTVFRDTADCPDAW